MKINIKGPIIPNNHQWIYDWLGMEATSPKKVLDQLESANNMDIEVEINSGGGSVYDASEIYTNLKDYQGKTTGKIVGLAASAASVIAMGVDILLMSPTGQMMIHNASTWASGDYRDMNQTSDFLKNVNQSIANAYSLKSGKPYDELLSMMDAETWLTAHQAKEHQLIDDVMFEGGVQIVASTYESGLLPNSVIDKLRNEIKLNQIQDLPLTNQVALENKKEAKKAMNIEQLKNDYPELYEQVRNAGYDDGVNAENSRIKAIEDLGIPGSQELMNKAKFETKASAEQVAVEIIKAQKELGTNFLNNRFKDAQPLNKIDGDNAPDNNAGGNEEQEIEDTGSVIANFVNKKRGGRN